MMQQQLLKIISRGEVDSEHKRSSESEYGLCLKLVDESKHSVHLQNQFKVSLTATCIFKNSYRTDEINCCYVNSSTNINTGKP
jgi:hypothetical protein